MSLANVRLAGLPLAMTILVGCAVDAAAPTESASAEIVSVIRLDQVTAEDVTEAAVARFTTRLGVLSSAPPEVTTVVRNAWRLRRDPDPGERPYRRSSARCRDGSIRRD
jgi:hypothetical protein